MKCPYCHNEVQAVEKYCPVCGQPIIEEDYGGRNHVAYWNKIGNEEKNIQKNFRERRAKITNKKRKNRMLTLSIIVIICLISIGIVSVWNIYKMHNQEKLEIAERNIVGKEFEVVSGSAGWFDGDKRERIIVKFKENGTVKYTRGDYIFKVKNSGKGFSWQEDSIKEKETYNYDISISNWGNVLVNINGKSYDTRLDEEGNISKINLFDD